MIIIRYEEIRKKWSEQISETRQLINKYYNKAVDEDDFEIADIMNDLRNDFEEIDDKYLWDR